MHSPDNKCHVSPDEAFLARWTYEQLAILRDQTFGPALRMPEYCLGVYDILEPALERIVGPHRTEDVGNVVEVPTPWHAALILDSLQHHLCLEKRRAVFRGQADSKWGISSSISRPGVDVPREKLKASLFCDILRRMSFNNSTILSPRSGRLDLQIPPESYLAAAQHYGIKTELIDYTPDPAVAVFFAASEPNPMPGRTASVYVLSLDDALANGCEVIIPPPFVERLHLQRGFFIKHRDSHLPLNMDSYVLVEVRFPVEYEFWPFRLVRRGVGVVDLLPTNPDIDSIMEAVNEAARTMDLSAAESVDCQKIVTATCENLKRSSDRKTGFSGFYHDPLLMWAKYLDAFEDMLYWTAYYADATNLSVDKGTLSHIVRSNRVLIDSVKQLYQWTRDDPEFECTEQRKEFIDRITSLLSADES